MKVWDRAFDDECTQLIHLICQGEGGTRRNAWTRLLLRISPRIEEWSRRNRALRRCRLDSDDDARTVLVDVLERLAANDFENLRRYAARRPPGPVEGDDVIDAFVRLAKIDEADDEKGATGDDGTDTPFRAWLLTLVDFAARDHIRRRLGTSNGQSKRDLHTDARRLDDTPEPILRPPLTDYLTLRALVDEVREQIARMPEPMQRALELWLNDAGFQEIARQTGIEDADRARDLVRAAQARLRHHFRGRSSLLCAS